MKKLLILVLFLALFKPPIIKAQSFSLGITPPLLEVMMKPGKTITQVYQVINQGASAQVYADIVAFEPSNDLGNINLIYAGSQQPAASSYLSWFSFQNADISLPGGFLLKPGQSQQLVLKIKVPEIVEEQDYYASLILKVNPNTKTIASSGTLTSGMIAGNILLTVSADGKPPINGKISNFAVMKKKLAKFTLPFFDSFDAVPLSLTVDNTGKTLFKPMGSVKIINPFNQEVEFLEILPQNVLAHSQRQLYAKGNEEQIQKPIVWEPRGLKIGRYQARADLILSESNKKIASEVSFLLLPWKAGLGIIISLILIQLIIKKVSKFMNNK
jgi:hypothetical protein